MKSKKKLVAERRRETHFLSNEEKEKFIKDYFERETAGERKRVADGAAMVKQHQHSMRPAEIPGLTSREHEKACEKVLVAIAHSLSDHASSNDGEDGEDKDDEETENRNLSQDDKPA
jgi:hypothetical protein